MSDNTKTSELDADEIAALKAQQNHNKAIAACHVEILKRLQRLEKIGGEQDYTVTIMEALQAFGGSVSLAFLAPVLPDHGLLVKARAKLVQDGCITETSVKNRKTLHLIQAAA
jgi:hypothetical protein